MLGPFTSTVGIYSWGKFIWGSRASIKLKGRAGVINAFSAWIDCARRDAERMLIWPGVPHGSYIIRSSAGISCSLFRARRSLFIYLCIYWWFADSTSFALSVRLEDPKTQLHTVRHYRVRSGAGGTYFVSHNRTFQGFSKLIEHYSSAPIGPHWLLQGLILP